MLYLLDANTLIDANRDYYPLDRVPEFWDWLLRMGSDGVLKLPIETYQEIIDGNDDLANWLKENKAVLLLHEEAQPNLVDYVTITGYAANLTDDEIEVIGADPFLIAYALRDPQSRIVVSNETSKPSRRRANRKVPDVCTDLSNNLPSNSRIECINTFVLIRRLDFKTR